LISTLIIVNGSGRSEGRSENPIWNNMEQLLLYALILHAAACEPELGHMGAIRWLLLSGMQQTRKVLQNSPSHLARMEFEGWLSTTKAEEFRYSILGGLMAKLNPWKTDEIVAITSCTDLDLAGLRDQLFTFYLAVPINWHASKLVGALIFNFLVGYLLQHRRQIKRPIALMLDEFTHFGKIPDIAALLGIVRKAGIGMVLGFQNVNQLDDVYNSAEAHTIVDMPATQVFFRSKNFREARDLSDSLGRTTVEQSTVTDSGRVQESAMGRALATPEELLNLDREVIVFTADTWPVKTALTAPDAYAMAGQYPPPERPTQPVSDFIRRRGREAREDQKTFEQTVAEKTKGPEPDETDPSQSRRRNRQLSDAGDQPSHRPGAQGTGDSSSSQGTARGGGTRRPPKSRNAPDSRLF
jgi:type IV secretory pathway TraG/TraD family ATPase VirD4